MDHSKAEDAVRDEGGSSTFTRVFAYAGLSDRARSATSSVSSFLAFVDGERKKATQRQLSYHADIRATFVAAYELYRGLQATSESRELLRALKEKYGIAAKLNDDIGIVLQSLTNYTNPHSGKVNRVTLSKDRGALSYLVSKTDLELEDVDSFIAEQGGISGLYGLYRDARPPKTRRKKRSVEKPTATVKAALKQHLRKDSDEALVCANLTGKRKFAPWSRKLPHLSAETRTQFLHDLDQLVEKYCRSGSEGEVANA